MPSDMAYRKAFGSWGNAIRECGYEVKTSFPSEKCKMAVSKAKKGKLGTNWKGGKRTDKYGYILVWNKETQRYDKEHRVLMEKYIGRKLNAGEDVHHINRIKSDNRIENLQILSKSAHSKIHEKEDLKHIRHESEKCIYPDCNKITASKYRLCRKHYKSQWRKMQNESIHNLHDFNFKERKHTDKTRQKLSEISKRQPRKNGKFSIKHTHTTSELLTRG